MIRVCTTPFFALVLLGCGTTGEAIAARTVPDQGAEDASAVAPFEGGETPGMTVPVADAGGFVDSASDASEGLPSGASPKIELFTGEGTVVVESYWARDPLRVLVTDAKGAPV